MDEGERTRREVLGEEHVDRALSGASEYARTLYTRMKAEGFRVTLDEHSDKLGAKIRRAELEKIPYTLVIGQKEADANSVSVRSRARGDEGVMTADDYIAKLKTEVTSRALPVKKPATAP